MARLTEWFRNWIGAGLRRAEFNRLDAAERSRIASDIGMSVIELEELASARPGASLLLPRRLRALGLDPLRIARAEPATLRDLERGCSHCLDRAQCRRDLAADPEGSAWQAYCPNAATILALRSGERGGVPPQELRLAMARAA